MDSKFVWKPYGSAEAPPPVRAQCIRENSINGNCYAKTAYAKQNGTSTLMPGTKRHIKR